MSEFEDLDRALEHAETVTREALDKLFDELPGREYLIIGSAFLQLTKPCILRLTISEQLDVCSLLEEFAANTRQNIKELHN